MNSKPTVVLLHGAWHTTASFDRLSQLLNASGFPTCAVQLPSSGGTQEMNDFQPDVAEIKSKTTPILDEGKELILFMHSYSGAPASEVVRKLNFRYRQARGLNGGITHLIYCAAIIASSGKPIITNKELLSSSVILDDAKTMCFPTETSNRFYGDLNPKEAEHYTSLLKWQNVAVFNSTSSYSAYKDVESTYIFCEKDQAFPVEFQRHMVDSLGKDFFTTVTLSSAHSPFLSMPQRIVEVVKAASDNHNRVEVPGDSNSI